MGDGGGELNNNVVVGCGVGFLEYLFKLHDMIGKNQIVEGNCKQNDNTE